jgi:hypothetical protein
MRTLTRCSTLLALLLTLTPPLQAQDREGVMGDLIRDVATVETKILGLARTMPPTVYEWTGIDGRDNKTVAAFEARPMTRDQIIAELSKSFAFLKQAMSGTLDATLASPPKNSTRKKTTVRAT